MLHATPCFTLRRPMVGVALAVVSGMASAAAGLVSFSLLLAGASGCILLAILLNRSRASGVCVFVSVAMVSACRFMVASQPLSAAEIIRLQPRLPMDNVPLAGRVLDPPEYQAYRSGPLGAWVLILDCEGVEIDGKWMQYRGRLQVRVTGAQPGDLFRQGQRIRFTGTLRKRRLPGGVPVEMAVRASDGWMILSGPPRLAPLIWGQRWRAAAARTLSNGIEERPNQLAVYRALLLGYRKAMPPEIHRQFKRTGTLHIFAISGLHVGIAGLLITVVLRTAGIPRDRWGYWLLPLLLGYVVTTGMKSSALRALTMAAVYFLAPLFRRKPDVPVSIAFAAILLLFCKPLELLNIGFIFSFTVVSFIVMLYSVIPDGIIFRGAGWGRSIRAYIISLGVTSVAAFIGSVPVTALFFGSFSPVSLMGNLVVVPLTFCIVLSGWLSIVVPPASVIFNQAALVFINGLLGTTELLAGLPGAHVEVPPPPLTALLFWYGGWIILFTQARSKRQRTTSLVLVSLAILLTILTPLL